MQQGEQQLRVRNLSLRVSIRGNGPPLLMFNGIGARIEVLDDLRASIPGHCTIAYDVPGIGGSEPFTTPRRLGAHADVAAALADQLGLDQFDVFGVSWGGALAQEFCHRHPKRVNRLILAATTPCAMILMKPRSLIAFFDLRKRESKAYARDVAPHLFGGPFRTDSELLFRTPAFRHLEAKRSRGYLFQLASSIGWTSLPFIWRVRQPTLIVAGSDDPLIRPYNAWLLQKLIPTAELAIIEGEGHFFIATKAKETGALIGEFLSRSRMQSHAEPSQGGLSRFFPRLRAHARG